MHNMLFNVVMYNVLNSIVLYVVCMVWYDCGECTNRSRTCGGLMLMRVECTRESVHLRVVVALSRCTQFTFIRMYRTCTTQPYSIT